MLIMNNINEEIKMEKELQIKKVGEYLASLWGGKFLYHEIDEEQKEVIFFCIEHNEPFATSCTFTEMIEYIKMV